MSNESPKTHGPSSNHVRSVYASVLEIYGVYMDKQGDPYWPFTFTKIKETGFLDS